MSKYIDADKLIAELRRQKRELEFSIQSQGDCGQSCQIAAYEKIRSLINSLQQEHLEVDLEKEMDNDYDSPLWDGEDVSWMTYTRIARHFYEFGLNARKEQSEIELDKFIDKVDTFQRRYKHPEIMSIKGAMAFMARMFYQYPNVAKEWYEQLSKATMD